MIQMHFEFDLGRKRLPRRQRRGVYDAYTGVAGPYGEVTITVTKVPQKAELSSATLPSAWILHPEGLREGRVYIDDTTRLAVGDQEAKLTQNRHALRKEDRHCTFTSATATTSIRPSKPAWRNFVTPNAVPYSESDFRPRW
ncbi:hypothetical protein GCM10010106_38950 [Thermopolyspora flexuosa]|jgi:hypothetical protein|nr:hypothetical protein GCM10010106_38950 [Thermopolyspora flexuosa]